MNEGTIIDVPLFKKEESAGNQSLLLSCRNLKYSVNVGKRRKQTTKTILKGVDAIFRPGRLTSVMGASGAGKTTLLNLLAGEALGGQFEGKIFLNGAESSRQEVSGLSGFVFQDDVILETMTVREAIMMSATLRLPKHVSSEEKNERVDEMMEILNLTKCENTKIGSPSMKGISGGERKRVALAMELITNPPILFLDEPTSGLDTENAYNVVSLLADLAHKLGRTVVLTIHQPPSEVFHMMDDLLLLAECQVVYHGLASEAVEYFSRLGFKCPMYTNPADFFFLDLLGKKNHNHELNEGISEKLLEIWQSSPENSKIVEEIEVAAQRDSLFSVPPLRKHMAPFYIQFGYLIQRASKNVLRNRMIFQVKAMQSILIALLIGLIYLDINSKPLQAQIQVINQSGIHN